MKWPPPQVPLEGSIVRLEPIDPAHHDGLLAAARAPDTWTWLDRRVPEDEAAFGDWFQARLEASRAGEEWCFVTHSVAEDAPIGSSSFLSIRPDHDGLEIGWTWLHPDAWRTGANIEAKLLMLGFAFDELGCMRVEFKTDARNERSRAALAALPATFEGVFRKHMLMGGIGVRDSAYFSITDDEWPEVKANLQRRLAREPARA
jgi:N-acetyltransferase